MRQRLVRTRCTIRARLKVATALPSQASGRAPAAAEVALAAFPAVRVPAQVEATRVLP